MEVGVVWLQLGKIVVAGRRRRRRRFLLPYYDVVDISG